MVLEPPEKVEGEIARITYLGNVLVTETGTAPDPEIGYQMRVSCHGQGSVTAGLWVNGAKIRNGVTWECSDELPAAVNVDAAMPALQATDDVQIRFPEVSSNQEAWAVLEPAVSTEE